MTWRRLTATIWILAALTAGDGARPRQAAALQAGFSSGASADTLTVSAEGGQLPKYTVRRTGPQELTVTFQPAPGEKTPPPPGVGGSKLVSGVRAVPGGYKIQMKTSAFGYVNFPVSGKPQMQVQIFQDAVGAGWTDAKAAQKPQTEQEKKAEAEKKAKLLEDRKKQAETRAEETTRKKAEAAQKKTEAEQKKAEALEAKRAKQAPAAAPAAAKPEPQPAPHAAPAPSAPASSAPVAPAQPIPGQTVPTQTGAPGPVAQPYFSVPNNYRAPVNKTVLGPSGTQATMPAIAGPAASGSAATTAPQAKPTTEPPKTQQVGGKLPSGVVEKPIVQEHSTVPGTAAPEALPAPPAIAPSAPAQPALMQPATVDVQPQQGRGDVRFRADRRTPDDLRPADVISGTPTPPKVAGKGQLASAPASAGQPTRPWELRQQVQKFVVSNGGGATTLPQVGEAAPATNGTTEGQHAPAQQGGTAADSGAGQAHGPSTGSAAGSDNASAPGKDAHAGANETAAQAKDAHAAPDKDAKAAPAKEGKGGKDKEKGPLTEQEAKDQLFAAQSNMVASKWQEAATTLEQLLREPVVKGDLREEVLYGLGDTYMQLHKDNPAPYFDRIAGAQQAAMNSNQKSPKVPRALFNLGLLHLKVGNMAEAKAYFNIITKKYPQDQNASLIPYFLGEHYRAKDELQKAAEQYQLLIQKYPDSRPAKDAAYILAQILRKLGNYEKAFQIVDYIDKRWPLFYMENPNFLRVAAEIEEKVGKLAQAKDHFWTYYNLNPDAEFTDVTLVRIGDIYQRQNKRAAAKEMYQKTVRDFPDREGGQVARMRLAEEGIYDDPTMNEMISVFSRPDALKPNETYELIMTKYPQSPLAPLAQIKLGMWQFFNKSFLDAVNTASSFLSKYPKSPLVDKAKELGFNAFLQALPQLVQEGNYQRIMQIFDGASFVKENQDKIGDEARMAIAVSAWKRGDPDRALKLAAKYLGKQQVPKYSEMALDLAMNIFLERKQWDRIAELAGKSTAAWKLSPRQKTQFEYARAMAMENLGETEKGLPLWTKIASDTGADPATRAYATYALAKNAARKQDMHRLFALAQEALAQLLATGGDKEKIKDCLLMSITATERSGRFAEAAKWSREFDRIIPESDPDWAPVRLRLADIYQKGGMQKEWKELLQGIVQKKPGTVYARMAAQALESNALDQRLQNYLMQTRGAR